MQLRPYQEAIIEQARVELSRVQSVLVQAPTGSGKTALTVHMMRRAAERGISSMFLVHQGELLRQTSRALWDQRLEHGMICPGKRLSKLPAQVASVQTLVRRLDRYPEPGLIVIDEAHRAAADTYRRVLAAYPGARVVGLSATPQRTDGKGLADIFSAMVQGPSIRWLIDSGFLCDYDIFAPPSMADVSQVKTTAGDYNKGELEQVMDRPTITGDAVAHYRKHATGKRCVVMAVTVLHAEHIRDQYLSSGIRAEVIEGKLSGPEREAMIGRFERGETLVLVNVQLMVEGVDIPAIEVVQWLRPTKSLIIWMQANGRGFRPSPDGGKLLIMDHVGNVHHHGLPDEDREWSLEGGKKRKRKQDDEEEPNVTIQQCQQCWHVFRPGPDVCPACGADVPRRQPVEMKVVDAELQRIDLEAERKNRKREQGSARTLRQLVELGVRRGMNKPDAWSAITMAAREGRKPTRDEFQQAKVMLGEVRG